MRRLRAQSLHNSSEEFDRVFHERRKSPPQPMDVLRWEALLKFYKGGELIDLGCLDSLVPVFAKKRYPQSEIWGLDQAEEAIKALAEVEPRINYTHGDVYDTTFPDNYFSYVTAGELIEHLDDPQKLFDEAYRILKPGGIFALTTPKEETEEGEVDGHAHLWSFDRHDIKRLGSKFSKVRVGEIPSWLRRRVSYHHPYLLAYLTK